MGEGLLSQITIMSIALLIAFGASFVITFLLIKINKKLVFGLPVLSMISAIYFWVSGLLANDWGALGYLIIGILSIIALIGSIASSLIIYFKMIKPNKINE